jgi:hypothetical protein
MATIYNYQGYARFRFRNLHNMLTSVEFHYKTPDLPTSPIFKEMRAADEPLVMYMPNQDDDFAPIIPLTMDLRFYPDEDVNMDTFIAEDNMLDSDQPLWIAIVRMWDISLNLIFERTMFLNEQDSKQVLTTREHVVTLRLHDGLTDIKKKSFYPRPEYTFVEYWEQERNVTLLQAIAFCIRAMKNQTYVLWVIDNLEYDGDDTQPALQKTYININSYATGEGAMKDCYSVLESLLTDYRLELRPTSMGGWIIVRHSDYCRLALTTRAFKYGILEPLTLLESGVINGDTLKYAKIVEDGDIKGVDYINGRGHCSPVESYMIQQQLKPVSSVTCTGQLRNNHTTFPNEFMQEGPLISTTFTVKKYGIDGWDSVDVNANNPVSVIITESLTRYAHRLQDFDADGVKLFGCISAEGLVGNASSTVFKAIKSPLIRALKNAALKISWQHTNAADLGGTQRQLAVYVGTAGGFRWIQEDGSLGTNFYMHSMIQADMTNEVGRFGMTSGPAYPYFNKEFKFAAYEIDGPITYQIFVVLQNSLHNIKDFRVEFDYYYAGNSPILVEGQEDKVTRGGSGVNLTFQSTLQDTNFMDAAGTIFVPDIGDVQYPTGKLWRRAGFPNDVDEPKSFLHQQALSIWTSNRRFLRRIDATMFGMYIRQEEGQTYQNATIVGFQTETDLVNSFRLFRFLDRAEKENNRYWNMIGFRRYDVKGCKIDCTLQEVYTDSVFEEVNPSSVSPTHSFRVLYQGDRTPLDRTTLDTKNKQLEKGRGWWWLFGPLGYLVWGRKKKIGGG